MNLEMYQVRFPESIFRGTYKVRSYIDPNIQGLRNRAEKVLMGVFPIQYGVDIKVG